MPARHTILPLLTALALACGQASGTTVFPKEKPCPVCDETFVTTEIGSYSSFGQQPRDLSGSPFARFGGVDTCPYCLYSAQKDTFGDIAAADRQAIKTLQANLRLALAAPERDAARETHATTIALDTHLAELLLARTIRARLRPDAKRDTDLALLLFYHTKRDKPDGLHAFYRREAIAKLSLGLEAGVYAGSDRVVMTYLLGELLRQDSQPLEAIRLFDQASATAKSLPPKSDDESCDWIGQWAYEQTCRIRFATNSVSQLAELARAFDLEKDRENTEKSIRCAVALQALADRTDPEAWQVLAGHLMKSPEQLFRLDDLLHLTADKLTINPALWNWVREQYALAKREEKRKGDDADITWTRIRNRFASRLDPDEYDSGGCEADARQLDAALTAESARNLTRPYTVAARDTLSSIAKAHGTDPERLSQLNPRLTHPDRLRAGATFLVPKMPLDWPENRVLANLDTLIGRGNANAAAFLVAWLDAPVPEGMEYTATRYFKPLAANPGIWQPPSQQRMTRDCLAVLHGDKPAVKRLLPYVTSTNAYEARFAFAALGAVPDRSAVNSALDRLRNPKDNGFRAPALSYLREAGTAEDVPALRQIIHAAFPAYGKREQSDLFARLRLEGVLRAIQLRHALGRSLSD